MTDNESKQEMETGTQPQNTDARIDVRGTDESQDVVAEAKKTAKELKEGLEERKRIVEREEKLLARQEALRALGGGSQVGQKPEPHIETSKEYAERVMSGKILKK